MVTHIPSSNSSSSSLPLSSPTTSTFRPLYPSSQAGSSSASYHSNRRPTSSSRSSKDYRGNYPYQRSASTASTSSQTTLVPGSIPPAPQSVAGYPTSPPSAYSFTARESHHRAPSAASTSAARRSSGHRHRSSSRGRSRRELEREAEEEAQNTFPWFGQTGDVEITISDYRGRWSNRYLLHHLILAQNADWFEEDLAAEPPGGNRASVDLQGGHTNAILNSSPKIWRYELDWSSVREGSSATPLLVQTAASRSGASFASTSRPPPSFVRNKPSAPPSTFFQSLASRQSRSKPQQSSEDSDLLTAYDNLFLIFYNYSPDLSTSNIATAYVESKLLLSLASSYSALSVVGPRVDHHLLQFGSRLWKQIAKYPPSYLKLGHLARSKAIFSEALVHVVGQWPVGQPQLKRGTLADEVVDLVEDKVDELEEAKLRIEAKLFRISLTTGRGERVGPQNAYADWLAISLFRQWIAEHTAPAPVGILKDSPTDAGRSGSRASVSRAGTSTSSNTQDRHGQHQRAPVARVQPQTSSKLVRTYRLLAQGGQAYLPHDELKRFLKLTPEHYSRDSLRKFERRMEELKHLAKDAVRPLTRTCLELDWGGSDDSAGGSSAPNPASYLTCAKCEERDFAYVWRD